MVKKSVIVCSMVLALVTTSYATYTWDTGTTGNWSDPCWKYSATGAYGTWNQGASGANKTIISSGQVTADVSTVTPYPCAILLIGPGTLVVNNPNVTVASVKGSSELIGLGNGGNGTINQSGGTVMAYQTTFGAGVGKTKIYANSAYNLSGGILMTEGLERKVAGDQTANFNATGGTLVVAGGATAGIQFFGLYDAVMGTGGFHQGGCLLAPAGLGAIGTVFGGNSQTDPTLNRQDYFADTGTIQFDIASSSSYDVLQIWGNVFLAGVNGNNPAATLSVNLLGGYVPDPNTTFDVITQGSLGLGYKGTGSFLNLPVGWASAWVDTNSDSTDDTLRLTYIPEPVTLALLLLGGSALLARRRRIG
jgi:hypothetical protein